MLRPAQRLARLVALWARDRRGVAAIEFAYILPLMLVFFVGAVDVTRGVLASRKVALVSRTVADLVAQQPTTTTTSTATLATIFNASSAIMRPYSTNGITITVSAVTIQSKTLGLLCCDAKVNWSYTQGGTLRPCNVMLTQVSTGTPPAATNIQSKLITANQQAGYAYSLSRVSYLIVADVTYAYQPLLPQAASWFASGFQRTSYMVPRSASGQVTLTNANSAATGQSGAICS